MSNDQVCIEWSYQGKKDFLNGTGAYREEKFLAFLGSLLIPAAIIVLLISERVHWNLFQILLALFIAFDLGGGAISNALNSGKRFYHSPPQKIDGKAGKFLKNKLLFAAFHIQPFVIGLLYRPLDWQYGLFWYIGYMVSVLAVYFTPLYLKRPVAMLTILLAVLINALFSPPVAGFEWFIPVLFLKIIYGHMVREEPYRKIKQA